MKVSVCIPMYNESGIIVATANTLTAALQARFGTDYELLFCDDGSTDGSAELVRSLQLPQVRVLGYPQNRGKGCAIRTAMLEAQGDYVLFTDADLAYGTDVIGQAVEAFAERPECDLIIGSRNIGKNGYEGYTLLRRIASKTYIRVLCAVGGFRLSDSQCGCKAFTNRAAREIFGRMGTDGFAFDFEALMWADRLGYRVGEMPVRVINHRESKIHLFRDTFRMLNDLRRIKRRIRKPTKAEKKAQAQMQAQKND